MFDHGKETRDFVENKKERENARIIDSLCLPFMYVPIYENEKGAFWGDTEQLTSKTEHEYKTEKSQSFLIGEIKFHPISKTFKPVFIELNR